MQVNQTQPLQLAAQVLEAGNLAMFRATPFNRFGWAILDRWAMNSPQALKVLEAQGAVTLFNRVLTQQRTEEDVLDRNQTLLSQGSTPMEVLAMNEVATELAPETVTP